MPRRDPVAKVYAEALAGAAGASAADVEQAFDSFSEAWRTDPQIRFFLLAPNLPAQVKRDVLAKALAGAPAVFLNFLGLVVDKGRASALPSIHEAFRDLRDEASGRVRVLASTASAMTPPQSSSVSSSLAEKLKREVVLESQVKPELIGGIRLQVGDWVADGTVARRLRDMARNVMAARPPEGAGAWSV